MNANLLFDFNVDKANKKVIVKREFPAPVNKVWAAWTESELLDKWWAPKPWKAETKSMDFTPGGRWLYAMVSPEGQKHWSLSDYQQIEPQKSFSALNAFSDSDGNIDPAIGRSSWTNTFSDAGNGVTLVNVEIRHDKLEDLEKYIEMGFKEGFTMGLGNLEELLASQQ
ncbi:MAG: SRPBCC domain-containing protein [Flavobacterium sp.]|nr:MAG: SRPBCC domain-containing protein [Flavobacterium sp.]